MTMRVQGIDLEYREGGIPREYGRWHCLDWRDGPLLEIAVVTFPEGPALIEAKTIGFESEGGAMTHVRFTRQNLVDMLDMLDGRPVRGFFDDKETP